MKLKSINYSNDTFTTTVVYELYHCTPGRSGTKLSEDLTMRIIPNGGVVIKFNVAAEGETPELALDKLRGYLERFAEALRNRRENQNTAPCVTFNIPSA